MHFLDDAADPLQPMAEHSTGAATDAAAAGGGGDGAGTSSGMTSNAGEGMQQQQAADDDDSCFCPWELWPAGVSTDQVLAEQPKLDTSLVSCRGQLAVMCEVSQCI